MYGGESGTKARLEHLAGGLPIQEARADTFVYLKPDALQIELPDQSIAPHSTGELKGAASDSSLSSIPASGAKSPGQHTLRKTRL